MPKRRASNGFKRAAKRFKRTRTARKVYAGRRTHRRAPIRRAPNSRAIVYRPPFVRNDPIRVRAQHRNVILVPFTATVAGEYTTDQGLAIPTEVWLYLNRLRDPDVPTRGQPYPENFIRMAQRYRSYRVTGVKITAHFEGVTNNENDKVIVIAYDMPSHEANASSADPLMNQINSASTVGAILQKPNIRRHSLISTGQLGGPHPVWKMGYFRLSQLEHQRRADMDDNDYSGSVFPNGSVDLDPLKSVGLRFRIVSARSAGFSGGDVIIMRLSMMFDVEWFNRRATPVALTDNA